MISTISNNNTIKDSIQRDKIQNYPIPGYKGNLQIPPEPIATGL